MNIVSVGSLNEALINPREIFKSAILSNAHSMMLIHNHPYTKSDTIYIGYPDYSKNAGIRGIDGDFIGNSISLQDGMGITIPLE
ncbi:MAG: JAB domain-containing protein [Blautia sp.]